MRFDCQKTEPMFTWWAARDWRSTNSRSGSVVSVADLSPPWILFCDGGAPIAILPAGRPGEVLNVEGWPLEKAQALIDAANQESASFNARMTKATERLLELSARTDEAAAPQPAETEAWVLCSERMPQDEQPVWLFEDGWAVAEGYRELETWRAPEGWRHSRMRPTHWMPRYVQARPAPPNQEPKSNA